MNEQTTIPVSQQPVATPPAPVKKKKKKSGHPVRTAIVTVVVLALLSAGGYFLWKYLSATKEEIGELITDFASRGSVSSMITGSGNARATNSKTITLAAAGKVQELYVTEGQIVNEGDPLYVITSETAQKVMDDAVARVAELQKGVANQYKSLAALETDMNTLNKELAEIKADQAQSNLDRTVKAPFAGQLQECTVLHVGSELAKGTKIGTLVDDSKFRLSLYFSYAYEGQIKVGQSASVSITSSMSTLTGTVEEVNMVRRVSPEGSVLFETVIVIQNPGALAKGAAATATLTTADGTAIYPYAGGTLDYFRITDILTKTTGKILENHLMNYADTANGQTLLVLSEEDFSDRLEVKSNQIESKKTEIKTANEAIVSAQKTVDEAQLKVTEAQQDLVDFSATAPMTGTVISCSLAVGETVESGRVAITIADNTEMTIDINVDERNFSFIKTGMTIDLNDWNGNAYPGIVQSVSLTGKNENGVTTYPAVVTVDNPTGSLVSGMGLDYSFAAKQSLDCIVIPLQCIRYISDAENNTATAVFLKADSKPENALEVTADMAKDVPDGFYVVPVTVGITDNTNAEVIEGLEDGAEVFTNYIKQNNNSFG